MAPALLSVMCILLVFFSEYCNHIFSLVYCKFLLISLIQKCKCNLKNIKVCKFDLGFVD